MNNSGIGKRIRQQRETNKISQETLAELTGLSVTYIGMIERGERVPKLETFIIIANVLGVSADELLADVLSVGYKVKYSKLSEQIDALEPSDRDTIYDVVETLIRHSKISTQ